MALAAAGSTSMHLSRNGSIARNAIDRRTAFPDLRDLPALPRRFRRAWLMKAQKFTATAIYSALFVSPRNACGTMAASAIKPPLSALVLDWSRPATTSVGAGIQGCHSNSETHMNIFSRFVRDESGATAIEYGLIAALIAVVIISAVSVVGTSLSTTFTTISGNIK
jgi:pilus assembly protein Flp/PilA